MCLLNTLCTFILRLVSKGSTFFLTKTQTELEKVKNRSFNIALKLRIYFSEKLLFLPEKGPISRKLWVFGIIYIFLGQHILFSFQVSIFYENPSRFQGARGSGNICTRSPSELLCKISVLKNVAKFTEKHQCQVFFLTKLQA